MERVVAAAETETDQVASDGPGPPVESPTTEGMAKTGLREPQTVFTTSPHNQSPAFYASRLTVAQGTDETFSKATLPSFVATTARE